MAQVIEDLSIKCETLSSNSIITSITPIAEEHFKPMFSQISIFME
jgi:hypothetical protein